MDFKEIRDTLHAMYGGENKQITDGCYDQLLAVKCVNGIFVGKKKENVIIYRGIPLSASNLWVTCAGKRR